MRLKDVEDALKLFAWGVFLMMTTMLLYAPR